MILNKGRVVIIKKGRDFGKKAMIIEEPKDKQVAIEGPHVKKRSISIFHVWPLDKTVKSVNELK